MNSRMRALVLALGISWLGASVVHAEWRTFTSTAGITKKGELISVKEDQVTIKWEDGSTTTAGAASFCGADNVYFKEHAAAVPTTNPPAPTESDGALPADAVVIQAYIDGHSELRITKSGIYWTNGRAAKPGMGGNNHFPTYVGGAAWIPKWGNAKAKGRDKCELYPIKMGDPQNLDFKLISVGPEKESVGIEKRDDIKLSTDGDEFSVYIPDRQRGARWYKFALIPKKAEAKP